MKRRTIKQNILYHAKIVDEKEDTSFILMKNKIYLRFRIDRLDILKGANYPAQSYFIIKDRAILFQDIEKLFAIVYFGYSGRMNWFLDIKIKYENKNILMNKISNININMSKFKNYYEEIDEKVFPRRY